MSNAERCRRYQERRRDHVNMIGDRVDMLAAKLDALAGHVNTLFEKFQQLIDHVNTVLSPPDKKPSDSQELTPPISPLSNLRLTSPKGAKNEDFEIWWAAYPHKIGKGGAKTKYRIALTKTSSDVLLAALERYKATKPPERDWCNPATWLHQERWTDVPAINGHASDSNVLPFGGPPTEPPPIPQGGFFPVGRHH
jgi:hypothetical protein